MNSGLELMLAECERQNGYISVEMNATQRMYERDADRG